MIVDGEVTCFEDVRKVIRHPPTIGEYRRGEEFEGRLQKGEKAWETPADIALFKHAEIAEFDDPATCTTALVAYEKGDDVVEWGEGNRIAKKLEQLRRLLAEAKALALTPTMFHLAREITNTERGRLKKGSKESRANALFR